MKRILRLGLVFCGAFILSILVARPSLSHWADLAVAEVVVQPQTVEMNLTLPTGLIAFADDDRSGQLSQAEFDRHAPELRQFLDSQIQVSDRTRQVGTLGLNYGGGLAQSAPLSAPSNSHSTLKLRVNFQRPLEGLTINYRLFLPDVPSATCLASILIGQKGEQFIFSPRRTVFSATGDIPFGLKDNLWLAILGALVWGGMHALSPGHGKTLVGAYLVGERSTWMHAVVLGLVTTVTHTIGVFAMGLLALGATQFFAPNTILPWLSLAAGLGVLAIGLQLLWQRCKKHLNYFDVNKHSTKAHHHDHDLMHGSTTLHHHDDDLMHGSTKAHHHDDDLMHGSTKAHHHDHDLMHSSTKAHHHDHDLMHDSSMPHHHDDNLMHSSTMPHHHDHDLTHDSSMHHHHDHDLTHSHSHLPESFSWRGLIALGIAGGLTPCPAALVLLLGSISLHQVALGIGLVLCFSLGLAAVLVALGLVLIGAKRWFQKLPMPPAQWKFLPVVSALLICVVGFASTLQAAKQIISL